MYLAFDVLGIRYLIVENVLNVFKVMECFSVDGGGGGGPPLWESSTLVMILEKRNLHPNGLLFSYPLKIFFK